MLGICPLPFLFLFQCLSSLAGSFLYSPAGSVRLPHVQPHVAERRLQLRRRDPQAEPIQLTDLRFRHSRYERRLWRVSDAAAATRRSTASIGCLPTIQARHPILRAPRVVSGPGGVES